jgi:hypothetical protein
MIALASESLYFASLRFFAPRSMLQNRQPPPDLTLCGVGLMVLPHFWQSPGYGVFIPWNGPTGMMFADLNISSASSFRNSLAEEIRSAFAQTAHFRPFAME